MLQLFIYSATKRWGGGGGWTRNYLSPRTKGTVRLFVMESLAAKVVFKTQTTQYRLLNFEAEVLKFCTPLEKIKVRTDSGVT